MDFTHEQRDAIFTHDRDLIVTAGAGSGKTRVLVERFMALLDAHPGWALPSVVAITFTEKAAREMRDRVRLAIEDRIRRAVDGGDAVALDRWLEHQAALTRARIGTIHSLCASILRANPAEAALDPAFDVLDENEAAILLDDAVEAALARLAHDDHPAAARSAALLAAYDVRAVRRVLLACARSGSAADVRAALDTTPEALIAGWRRAWDDSQRDLCAAAREDDDLRAACDAVGPDDLPPGDKLSAIWELVFAYQDALFGDDPAAWGAAVEALADGIKINVGSGKNWGGEDALRAAKTALGAIRDRARALRESMLPPPDERDDAAAGWLVLWGQAIQLAAEEYARLKTERTALDFDDLEAGARDLLEQYPGVVARYAAELNHVLVDEFQDTNAAQRDIVYRLAGMGVDGCAGGRLFVVGDPKQSIYAFRGADVSVFGAVRDDLIAWGGQELPLMTSFRTHANLVGAFNDLFGRILGGGAGAARSAGAGRYEVALGQPMAAFRASDPHAVPEHAQPLTVFALPRPDKEQYPDFGAEEIRRWEAQMLADHIHGLVRRGVRVWDRRSGDLRAVRYGDVALLFQAMTHVPLYEDVFKTAGLPYLTVAGKGYYDRQEVRDLLNLLAALHNPADDLALAVALRSPLFGLSDDALFALRLARGSNGERGSLWDALFSPEPAPMFPADDLPARDFAVDVLAGLRAMAGRAAIADVLSRALEQTGYLATLTGLPDGARRRGNVEKLVALARASGRVSLGAFDAYARELVAREVREGEVAVDAEGIGENGAPGVVTLMSVHASKGLEFPVVALADTSWDRARRADTFTLDPEAGPACALPTDDPQDEQPESFAWEWAKRLADRRDRAERRRLLYVGATRAQEYLIVSGTLHRCGQYTWLRQWLDALGVDVDSLETSADPQVLRFAWGSCALYVPESPPGDPGGGANQGIGGPASTGAGWDHPAVRDGRPVKGIDPALPPLLADVQADPHAPARVLTTATHIARLGRAPFYRPPERGRAAFRQSVLYDTPDPVRPLPERALGDRELRRVVGDIVHRALRAWTLPDVTPPDALDARLRVYAWEAGLTHPDQIALALREALALLRAFEASELAQELEAASQVYREIPFVHRAETREIHGVIDVLYFDRHSEWHVLDYKTAPVTVEGAYANARRYYLQVGVYARAVEAKTGQLPHTHLYYIHPGRLIYVKPEDWGAALARLDGDVRAALE